MSYYRIIDVVYALEGGNKMIVLMLAVLVFCVIALDVGKKIHLIHPLFLAGYLPVALNVPLLYVLCLEQPYLNGGTRISVILLIGVFMLYVWLHLHVFPVWDGRRLSVRLKIMIGGSPLLYSHMYGVLILLLEAAFLYPKLLSLSERIFPHFLATSNISLGWLLGINLLYGLLCAFALFANGFLRVIFTSRRLSIIRRILIFLFLWIPGISWVLWVHTARLVREEYDFAWEKKLLDETRVENHICRTKYPIVLVHGLFFRDSRYVCYWGRIPRVLKRHGATIFHGNQEAAGSIAYNAQQISDCVARVIAETGAEKVNIIAHSKGGLDSRYAITHVALANQVASLTTMGTPHHGCLFVDKLLDKMPESFFGWLTRTMDRVFRKWGDQNPQAEVAIRQFCIADSGDFNQKTTDMEGVYYQSYTSTMNSCASDFLLSIPYAFIRRVDGENDGLVSVTSAKWGNFRGVLRSPHRRGISHADQVDMKREDYRGFDVTEHYVQMVSELREMGF